MWEALSVKEDDASRGGPSGSREKPALAFHAPTTKRVEREALSTSNSVAELNRVRHAGNTKADIATAVARDPASWESHLASKLAVKGVLWLIRLKHSEGAFPMLSLPPLTPSHTQSFPSAFPMLSLWQVSSLWALVVAHLPPRTLKAR